VAIDLGVGMGIAALTLARHFEHVIGVDCSEDMIAAAHRNIQKLRVTNIELYVSDARHFTANIDRVSYVYMFNPFPETIMTAVMDNLCRSLERMPRAMTIIYNFPICHDALISYGFTRTDRFIFPRDHDINIYSI